MEHLKEISQKPRMCRFGSLKMIFQTMNRDVRFFLEVGVENCGPGHYF